MSNDEIIDGMEIGGYTLNTCIGIGGNGFVYRLNGKNKIVMKILFPKFNSKKQKKRFLNEINFLEKNNDYDIAPKFIKKFSNVDNFYWFTMEKCTKIDKKYESKSFTFLSQLKMCVKLIEKVKLIHSIGIAHRDIKPDNILFRINQDTSYEVLLTDFGLHSTKDRKNLTSFDENVGSYTFTPPELRKGTEKYNNLEADKKSDIYSLVKTIWAIIKKDKNSFSYETDMNYDFNRFNMVEYSFPNLCLEPLYELIDKTVHSIDIFARPTEEDCINAINLIIKQLTNDDFQVEKELRIKALCRKYRKSSTNLYIDDQNIIASIIGSLNELGDFCYNDMFFNKNIESIDFNYNDKNIFKFCNNSFSREKEIVFYIDKLFISLDNKISFIAMPIKKLDYEFNYQSIDNNIIVYFNY